MRKIKKIEQNIPNMPKRKRVAAYARVSVTIGDRPLHSLSAQVSHYSAFIQNNREWEYAGVYADLGQSGTNDSRDEFGRLIADCENGKVDVILTKSISRFARNTVDLLETVRRLREINVEVRFEREGINSMSGDGELMLSILASFAQEETGSLCSVTRTRVSRLHPPPNVKGSSRWSPMPWRERLTSLLRKASAASLGTRLTVLPLFAS